MVINALEARWEEIAKQLAVYFRGAEGDEGEADTGQVLDPDAPEGQDPSDDDDAPSTDEPKAKKKETFDAKYVEELRREAAKHRKEAQDLKKAEAERKKAEMDELTRAKTERDEAAAKTALLEAALQKERFETALMLEAIDAKMRDPQDAIMYIKPNDIEFDDDGRPVEKSVREAVKNLVKAKPYLKGDAQVGSGDGGAQGQATKPEDKVAAYTTHFQEERGMVPIPR